MIPKIDIIKWHYELDIPIDDIAELVDLFEKAKKENMRVNEMLRRMTGIVRYQAQVSRILGTSPSMVSLRVNDRAGITDRVLKCPSVSRIKHVLDLFIIWETTCFRILNIYENNPRRYSTPKAFTELLNAFGIYSKADAIAGHLFC